MRGLNKYLRNFLQSPQGVNLLGLTKIFYPNKNGNWLEINELDLFLPNLPKQLGELKVVQMSDVHLGTWIDYERLSHAVNLANSYQPDIVAITGDFVTHSPEKYRDDLVKAFSRLKPRYKSLAVLGNHDHWTDADVIRDILSQAGVSDLSNQVYTLERQGERLHFAGIDDFQVGADRLDVVMGLLPVDGCAILLAHEPDFADISAAYRRFDLQLSGHSHGGQVVLPLLGAPILPRHGRRYIAGLHKINGMYLYTNRGLGTAEIQIRINCPPEITVFTLHPGPSPGA